MDYDVIILGGGLVGCATACALSKYNLNIAVIERNFDIAEEVASYITTFVTDGSDIVDEGDYNLTVGAINILKEKSIPGNFSFRLEPTLTGFESEECRNDFLERVERRNIKGVRKISDEEVHKLSPNLQREGLKFLYHENTGIVSPYDLATSYGEIASENGVRFKFEEEITNIEKLAKDEIRVTTKKGKYSARLVIITAFNDLYLGNEEKKIARRDTPLQTILLEKNFENDIKTMVHLYRNDATVTSLMPTFNNKTVATIENKKEMDYRSVKKTIESLIGPFPSDRVDLLTINNFYEEPLKIIDEIEDKGFINIMAKNHNTPLMLPKVLKIISEKVSNHFDAKENSDFIYRRRDYFKFRDMSDEEIKEAIKFDSRFGKIICTCSNVTEGEIVNAIRRPLGARTLEGVRRRTGMVFGSCQGAYCLSKVLKIISSELDKKPEEILNNRKNSEILPKRIKEFDTV